MLRKILCVMFSLLLVLPALFVSGAAAADDSVTHYEYPITVESEDWFSYSVREKVEMLRIPEETLSRMTDESLVTAIVEYPYLCDLYVYGFGIEDGIQTARSYFSALDELLKRDTCVEALKEYGLSIASDCRNSADAQCTMTSESYYVNDFLANTLCELLTTVSRDTSIEAVVSPDSGLTSYRAVDGLNSPSVSYSTPAETHTESKHESEARETASTYGVTYLRTGSCRYNCHSYAWYSTSASNIYWINDPSGYFSSYTCIYNGNGTESMSSSGVGYGDKVVYGGNTHSAIFVSSGASLNSVATGLCNSKWGQSGVFQHTLYNVPAEYDTSSFRFYR